MSEQENPSAAVLIQVADAEPEFQSDLSVAECAEFVARYDESMAESMRRTESRLAAISEDVVQDPDMTVEYFLLARSRARSDELLELDLEPLDPADHAARVDQYHRYTDIGSALLYQHQDYGGKLKFFSATWPNFKWSPYRFNDKASSAKFWGVNILFQHTWYRGSRLYLVGIPYGEFRNLSDFGFNDRASSFVSVG